MLLALRAGFELLWSSMMIVLRLRFRVFKYIGKADIHINPYAKKLCYWWCMATKCCPDRSLAALHRSCAPYQHKMNQGRCMSNGECFFCLSSCSQKTFSLSVLLSGSLIFGGTPSISLQCLCLPWCRQVQLRPASLMLPELEIAILGQLWKPLSQFWRPLSSGPWWTSQATLTKCELCDPNAQDHLVDVITTLHSNFTGWQSKYNCSL